MSLLRYLGMRTERLQKIGRIAPAATPLPRTVRFASPAMANRRLHDAHDGNRPSPALRDLSNETKAELNRELETSSHYRRRFGNLGNPPLQSKYSGYITRTLLFSNLESAPVTIVFTNGIPDKTNLVFKMRVKE